MSNMQKVFDAIASGKTSRPAIVADTGLTDDKVYSALHNLVKRGFIDVADTVPSDQQKGRFCSVYRVKLAIRQRRTTPLDEIENAWYRQCA